MQAGYTSDGNGNTIRLEVSTLSGFDFNVQLPNDALGRDLLKEIIKKCDLHGSQKVPMAVIGNASVSLTEDLGSQINKHGKRIALTFRQVQEIEQVNVTNKIAKGISPTGHGRSTLVTPMPCQLHFGSLMHWSSRVVFFFAKCVITTVAREVVGKIDAEVR